MGKGCERCRGLGVVTFSGPQWAKADFCPCTGTCAQCGGSGWVSRDRDGYTFSCPCDQCASSTEAVERFNKAGIPARFANADFTAFQRRLLNHDAVMGYLGNYPEFFDPGLTRGLMIMGPVGTGKTFLISAILRRLILEKRVSCRFVDFFCLLADLKRGYGAGKAESELMDPLADVPVLAIDELGKGREDRAKQDWELRVLDQIISRRYNARLPTIVTTNYIPSDMAAQVRKKASDEPLLFHTSVELESLIFEGASLEERVGARIYSRLREMCVPIVLYGSDFRCKNIDH